MKNFICLAALFICGYKMELLLKNAVESIQVGVEDYDSDDERRSVSAVRNIVAGLLLLFKTKLCQLSPPSDPELLIKKDLIPSIDSDGNLIFISKSQKTVDVTQIRERLSEMKVEVDWKRVEEITRLRNDIEHRYPKISHDAVQEIVAKSFILIRDFVQNALQQSPQELLEDDCWQVLLRTSEVYSTEENECRNSLSSIDWKYPTIEKALLHLRCPQCGSALIKAPAENDTYPEINLCCQSCNNEFSFVDVVENCVDELFSGDAHASIKDGGDLLYGTCPQCGQDTFILTENCCVACGIGRQKCSLCDNFLSLEEQGLDAILDGMCSHCKYAFEKMKSE